MKENRNKNKNPNGKPLDQVRKEWAEKSAELLSHPELSPETREFFKSFARVVSQAIEMDTERNDAVKKHKASQW